MYQNYIFDFYGTLADIRTDEENPYLWKKMSEIYSALGAAYRPEELKRMFRTLEQRECERIGTEDAEPDLTRVFALLYREKQVPCDAVQAKMTAVTFRALSREYRGQGIAGGTEGAGKACFSALQRPDGFH